MTSKNKIAYVDKIIPDAYHGTELKKALKILKEQEFLPSRSKKSYIGDGTYFYESSKWHAEQWCKRKFPDCGHGIICATINLGKCLDLHNHEHRTLLEKVRNSLVKKGYKKITDSFIINFYATKIEDFDTVRWTYTKIGGRFQEIYPGSKIHSFSQLIICVRNHDAILSMKLAMGGS